MKTLHILLAIASFAGARIACAQDDEAESRELVQRAAFEFIPFDEADGNRPQSVELRSEPLLLYSDPARVLRRSGTWLWTDQGRPAALLSIEFKPEHEEARQFQPDVWTFKAATFQRGDSQVQCADERWILKQGSGFEISISDAAPPRRSRAARLRQMKQIVRHFEAEATSPDEGEIALRLLPKPLFRYEEAVDGALFAFAYGTNPEVICAIEAATDKDGPHWKCGFAPLSAHLLTVEQSGQDVWQADRFSGPGTRDNYVNERLPPLDEVSKRNP